MRVFAVPQVARFLRKERLQEAFLCSTAREVVAGIIGGGEADLGGGMFKKRIARPGGGKRSGYRLIVAFRHPKTERVLFSYAFAKNVAATLTPEAALLTSGDVKEVECNGNQQG